MQQNQVAAAVPAKSRRARNAIGAAVLALASAAAMAEAVLPTEVTTAFSSVTDNFTAIQKLVWLLLGTTTAAYALIKIFKKNVGKAI